MKTQYYKHTHIKKNNNTTEIQQQTQKTLHAESTQTLNTKQSNGNNTNKHIRKHIKHKETYRHNTKHIQQLHHKNT